MAHCRQQVTDDCEHLLARFQKTESVRFEIFAKIWREMKFSEMFYGPTEGLQGKAFSRQILTTAWRYFLSPYTFQIRVGGLYLLYGLYSNQLARPKVQIQVALKDWEEVKRFEKDAAEAQHLDAVYILRKLFSQHAFCFAAMPRHLSYSQRKTEKKQSVCEEFMERASRPQELVNSELLEELSNVHEHYERYRLSQVLVHPDLVHPDLVHPDLVPQLRQTVMDFNSWQVETPVQAEEVSGEGLSQKESSHRAELLATIKSRSYGQAVEVSRSRRHRQLEVASHMTQRAPKKPTLKSRADTILIKSDIKKETSKYTKVWRLTAPETATDDVPRKKMEFKW